MRRMVILMGLLLAVFAGCVLSTYRVVPGRLRMEQGKPKISIRRACPCDTLKHAKRFRIG